jgi:hypothetical protein
VTDRTQNILDFTASAVVFLGTVVVVLPLALLGGDINGLTFGFGGHSESNSEVRGPARSASRAARLLSKR